MSATAEFSIRYGNVDFTVPQMTPAGLDLSDDVTLFLKKDFQLPKGLDVSNADKETLRVISPVNRAICVAF